MNEIIEQRTARNPRFSDLVDRGGAPATTWPRLAEQHYARGFQVSSITMRRTAAVLALVAIGCGDDQVSIQDGPMIDAPRDAPMDASIDAPTDVLTDAALDAAGNGAPCSTASDCASGLCVDTRTTAGRLCCADPCCSGVAAVNCDDGDPCTIDNCFPALGCRNIERSRCGDATQPAGGAYCDIKTRFPSCSAILDTDGDGLSDAWEDQQGIDVNCDGVINSVDDVPLPGANKNRPTIFLHFDYMQKSGAGTGCTTDADCTAVPGESCIPQTGAGVCTHSHKPLANSIARVVAAFNAKGIDLIIDPRHDQLTEVDVVTFADPAAPGFAACAGPSAVNFHALKALHFTPPTVTTAARAEWKNGWHYAIFSHHNTCPPDPNFNNLYCGACPPDRNGVQPFEGASGTGEYPGNDFIISLGDLYFSSGVTRSEFNEGGTLMHELGHNLNLHHNGDSAVPELNPIYLSVMNYKYQFNGIQVATAPGYPITLDPAAQRIDYSPYARTMLTVLDENSLDENTPVGTGTLDVVRFFDSTGTPSIGASNSPINWDGLGDPVTGNPINTAPVSVDLNLDDLSASPPRPPQSTFRSYDDWARTGSLFTNLSFDFQCKPWGMADGAAPLHNQARGELSPRQAAMLHVLYPTLTVSLDVPPRCTTNRVTSRAAGTVPVAVLGSPKLDVNQIDVASLRFAGIKPTSTAVRDVNGDGVRDLLVEVPMAPLIIRAQTRVVQLVGFLKNSQAIVGWDQLNVVTNPGPASSCKIQVKQDLADP